VAVNKELTFPEGEAIQNVAIDILDDIEIENDELVGLILSGFTENTEGLQSEAELLISSDDSSIGFGSPLYTVTEGQDGSIARIEIQRLGALLGELELSFLTATNGTAQAKADFLMVSNKVQFVDFETSKFVNVPVLDDDKIEPIESVVLILTNLVGNAFIKVDESKLNIIDNDFGTGEFSFEYPSFRVRENDSFASIGIVRTNGFTGIVEMNYELGDLTATLGEDYASEQGKVVFSDGDYVQFIDIPLIDDLIKEGAEAFKVRLVKATGDAVITPPNFVNVIILDDETEDYISTISGRGTDGPVYTIEADRYGFVIGGDYSEINKIETSKLSYIDLQGNVINLIEGKHDFNNAIYSTEILSNGILVGGLFNGLGDIPLNRLVKLNSSGLIDESFIASSRINSTVYDTLSFGGHIYVGGAFGILKLLGNGQIDESFNTDSIIGSVYAIASTGDGILVAGDFVNVDDPAQKNLAKINHDGAFDLKFKLKESPDAPVYSVSAEDDSILIVGGFVTVNGISSRRIASLNSDGTSNEDFYVGTGFNRVARKIQKRNDGNLIVSGGFDKWNDVTANKIVLLKPDGNLASNRFNQLNLNGTVYATDEVPGKLFAFGGVFNESEETPYNGLGVVEALTSPLPPELTIQYAPDIGLLTVKGQPSQYHEIEYSLDLVNWSKLVSQKTASNGEFKLNIDLMRFKSQYFRATMRE